MDARLASIDTHVEHLNADVTDLRTRFVRLDAKVDELGTRLDKKIDDLAIRLDRKIEDLGIRLDAKIDRNLLILGGMIVSLAVGMAGLMAKGFHWI